jgi:hypothetical protein
LDIPVGGKKLVGQKLVHAAAERAGQQLVRYFGQLEITRQRALRRRLGRARPRLRRVFRGRAAAEGDRVRLSASRGGDLSAARAEPN